MKNPRRARGVKDPGEVEREIWCINYDLCLNLALSLGWQSFSCKACTCFCPIQKTKEDFEDDVQACGFLIGVVFGWRSLYEAEFNFDSEEQE